MRKIKKWSISIMDREEKIFSTPYLPSSQNGRNLI